MKAAKHDMIRDMIEGGFKDGAIAEVRYNVRPRPTISVGKEADVGINSNAANLAIVISSGRAAG